MKKLALATLAVAASGASFAAAAPMMTMSNVNPWYVGVGVNYSANLSDKITATSTINEETDTLTAKLNSRKVGGNIFVGYQYNKFLGAEFGGSFQGNNTYKVTNETTGAQLANATVKNQWNVHLVGNAYLPVTDWFAPYAFGGVGYMSGKVNATSLDSTTATMGTFGFVYGAGAQFNINQFGIRAYYTRLNPSDGAADSVIPMAKDYISLDVLYRFGA